MTIDRRHFIGAGLAGSAVAGAALASGTVHADDSDRPQAPARQWYQGRGRRHRFDVDLAVLGYTNADNPDGAISTTPTGPGGAGLDTRGIIQYYEGVLYPGGSIPNLPDGQPDKAGDPNSITWLMDLPQNSPQSDPVLDCVDHGGTPAALNQPIGQRIAATGTFTNQANIIINRPCRPNPHFISKHHYFLSNELSDADISPADMLVSSGPENGQPPGDDVVRAVLGGTGYFKFVRGEVVQRRLGRNNSRIRGLGAPGQEAFAPNYRFSFDLVLW